MCMADILSPSWKSDEHIWFGVSMVYFSPAIFSLSGCQVSLAFARIHISYIFLKLTQDQENCQKVLFAPCDGLTLRNSDLIIYLYLLYDECFA